MKLKIRSKFWLYLSWLFAQCCLRSFIYNFKIKRAQEARDNQFLFQNGQSNEILEIFKMFRNSSWTDICYTKSKQTLVVFGFFIFNQKYPFWVNLVKILKIVSLSWNLVLRLTQISRIPWWCSLCLFSTRNTFLGKFGLKNQNCQFELKFAT